MSADFILPSDFVLPLIVDNFWVCTESEMDLTMFVLWRIK